MAYAGRRYDQPDSVPSVDGFILQAPVSDREAAGQRVHKKALDDSLAKAESMIKSGQGQEILPGEVTAIMGSPPMPYTAYRWHSLFAPQ